MNPGHAAQTIRVTPAGVLQWLTQPPDSAERDLVEHLLAHPMPSPPDMRSLSQALGRPVAELARALFNLHRLRSVRVEDAQAGPSSEQTLADDLRAIVAGRGHAVLADRMGLCLGAHGWTGEQADRAASLAAVSAASSPMCVRLHFSDGPVTLAANRLLDMESPAWVSVARRLLTERGAAAWELRA